MDFAFTVNCSQYYLITTPYSTVRNLSPVSRARKLFFFNSFKTLTILIVTYFIRINTEGFITALKREGFSDEMRGWYNVITVQGCNNRDRQWIHYSVAFGRMPNGSIQYLLLLS